MLLSRLGTRRFLATSAVRAVTRRVLPRRCASTHAGRLGGASASINYPSAGRAFVGGSALLGAGALCFYGSGMSPYMSTVEEAALWPAHVRQRISSTYMWFGAGLGLTALQTTLMFRSGITHRVMGASPMMFMLGGFGAMIGTQMLVHSIPAEKTIPKALAFTAFTGAVSLVISPTMLLGGAIVTQAAAYTGVVCGAITALAAVAPSDEFLGMGGPLMCGLGVLVVGSFGSMFFGGAAAGGAMHTVMLYGGTVLFGGFMLYDTQKIVARAKTLQVYDPCSASIGIYMNAINLFIRIAQMLAMAQGGGRK